MCTSLLLMRWGQELLLHLLPHDSRCLGGIEQETSDRSAIKKAPQTMKGQIIGLVEVQPGKKPGTNFVSASKTHCISFFLPSLTDISLCGAASENLCPLLRKESILGLLNGDQALLKNRFLSGKVSSIQFKEVIEISIEFCRAAEKWTKAYF